MSEEVADIKLTETVIGHTVAERLFLDAYNSKRLHHAWMMTGPKGVGKATLAWRFAKFLAAAPSDDEPAGLFGEPAPLTSLDTDRENPAVRRLLSGAHGDIMELVRSPDPKTGTMRKEIAVDQVRSVLHRFSQTRSEGGWRVLVIDAVDDMNRSAANALLKVLEEPPEKTVMLLVCHAPGRLLPTIRSRCRILPLRPLSGDSLQAVLAARFSDLSSDDMMAARKLADGAPGRAIKLIEDDGLALYRDILSATERAAEGHILASHQLADSLTGVKQDGRYRLFRQMMTDLVGAVARLAAGVSASDDRAEAERLIRIAGRSTLDRWLGLCEKVAERFDRSDAVNLDRRQVIISIFSDVQALCQARN